MWIDLYKRLGNYCLWSLGFLGWFKTKLSQTISQEFRLFSNQVQTTVIKSKNMPASACHPIHSKQNQSSVLGKHKAGKACLCFDPL